mgnify:CR=1 FL=1
METNNYTNFRTTTIIVVLYILLSAVILLAQDNKSVEKQNNNIATLVMGIKSNNEGLRKSAIYLAGKNQITEVITVLSEEFKNESKAEVKYLIAISLFKINTKESIDSACALCRYENNSKFKLIGNQINSAFNNSTVLTKK